MSSLLSQLLVLSPLFLSFAFAGDACYWPNGVASEENSYICNRTAYALGEGSACCEAGDTCTLGGVCYQGWTGIFYRQSCTDAQWNSSNCATVGIQGPLDYAGKAILLQCNIAEKSWCGTTETNTSTSCCGDTTKGVSFSPWSPGYTIAVLTNQDGNVGNNLLANPFSNASSPCGVSTTASIASATSATSSATSQTSQQSSTFASPTAISHAVSASTKVGVGVGVGLGVGLGVPVVLALGALLWTFARARKGRKLRLAAESRLAQVTSAGGGMQQNPYHNAILVPSYNTNNELYDSHRNELPGMQSLHEVAAPDPYK